MLKNLKKQVKSRFQSLIITNNRCLPISSYIKKFVLTEKMCLLILSTILFTYCKKKSDTVPEWLLFMLFLQQGQKQETFQSYYTLTLGILSIFYLILFGINLFFSQPQYERKHSTIFTILIFSALIMEILFSLTIFFTVLSINHFWTHINLIQVIASAMLPFIILMIIAKNVIHRENKTFALFFFVSLLLSANNWRFPLVISPFLLLYTLFFFKGELTILKKLLFKVFMLAIILGITIQYHNGLQLIHLIYFVIGVLAVAITDILNYLHNPFYLLPPKSIETNIKILETLKSINFEKKQKQTSSQMYQIQSLLLQTLIEKQNSDIQFKYPIQTVSLIKTPLTYWKSQQILKVLLIKTELDSHHWSKNQKIQFIIHYTSILLQLQKFPIAAVQYFVKSEIFLNIQNSSQQNSFLINQYEQIVLLPHYEIDKKSKNNINPSAIQHLDQLCSKYYQHIQQILLQLIDLWSCILAKTKNNKTSMILVKIVNNFQKIQKKLMNISEIYPAISQKALFAKVLTYINFEKAKAYIRDEMNSEQVGQSIKINQSRNINFMIIKQTGKIQQRSFKIFSQFNYKKQSFDIDQFFQLLPQQIREYFSSQIAKLVIKQSKEFVLPFLVNNNKVFFELKKISVTPVYIPMKGVRYFIYFFKKNSKEMSLLMYNCLNDLITNMSESFAVNFNLCVQQIQKKILNKNLFLNQMMSGFALVMTSNKDQLLQKKNMDGIIELNQFNKSRLNEAERSSKNVTVKIQEIYEVNQNIYYIFNIKNTQSQQGTVSSHFRSAKQTRRTDFLKIVHKQYLGDVLERQFSVPLISQLQLNQPQKYLHELYRNETFFCPVKNPYVAKIHQKRIKLGHSKTLKVYLIIAFVFLSQILLIYLEQILFNVFLNNKKQFFLSTVQNTFIRNEQEILLYQSYIQAFFLKHLTIYKSQFLANSNFTESQYKQIILFHSQQLDSLITNFQKNVISYSLLERNQTQINYTLKFINHQVDTSTRKLSILNYVQNFYQMYRTLKTDPILQTKTFNFLLNNYPIMTQLRPYFSVPEQALKYFKNNFDSEIIMICSVFSGSILITLIGFLVLYFFKNSIWNILSLQSHITEYDCKEKLAQLNIFLDSINKFNIYEPGQVVGENIPTENILKLKDQINQFGSERDNLIKEQKNNRNQCNQSSKRRISLLQQKDKKQYKLKRKNHQRINEQKEENCLNPVNFLYQHFSYCLLPLVLILTIVYQVTIMYQTGSNLFAVLEYDNFILRENVLPFSLLSDNYYQKYSNKTVAKTNINQNFLYSSNELPLEFMKQIGQIYEVFYKDLCQYQGYENQKTNFGDTLFRGMQCNNVFNGIFAKGTLQTLQILERSLNTLQNKTLSQYFAMIDQITKFPIIYQIFYTQQLMSRHIKEKNQKISDVMKNFMNKIVMNYTIAFIIQLCLTLLLTIIIFGYSLIKIRQNLKICFYFFTLIPEATINRMSFAKAVKQKNILENIDRLL